MSAPKRESGLRPFAVSTTKELERGFTFAARTHSLGFPPPAVLAEKIHQHLQRRPDLPSTRIVNKHPIEWRRRPIVEDGDKAPRGEVRSHVVERRLKQPNAFDRRPDSEPAIIDGQPSPRMNLHGPAFHSKAPRNESAARQANLLTLLMAALGSVAIASAIFLILEMSDPYTGLFRVSSAVLARLLERPTAPAESHAHAPHADRFGARQPEL